MTCIVAVKHNGFVFMGGDSAGANGRFDIVTRSDPKVFVNGPFVIGFTTSFRMGQLLHHSLSVPERGDVSVERFMATVFVDAVRKCLRDGGFAAKREEQEQGGNFLVGYAGRIFNVDSDYQVGESADCFDAVGGGYAVALGSLVETAGKSPRERVMRALAAAARFNAGVREPFLCLELKPVHRVACGVSRMEAA